MSIVGNIECHQFLFHPLSAYHSTKTKTLSIITNLALTILTFGIYSVVFLYMHLKDRFWIQEGLKSYNLEHLKQKQKECLAQLETLAQAGDWDNLRYHRDFGFDWWMFPIHRPSSKGFKYSVTLDDVAELKKDAEFMQNYRKGVVLVAKSWGWDLEKRQDISDDKQNWSGYEIRLWKMHNSLKIFDQQDLYENLNYFMSSQKIQTSWAWTIKRILF
ncbi:MAG: hypothetical protein JSS10_05390 [Verrucomicrobia bacterium]|nr:hypothetical protein [Verrucomicrobiota bacterium]